MRKTMEFHTNFTLDRRVISYALDPVSKMCAVITLQGHSRDFFRSAPIRQQRQTPHR
jgi:hypothetical protein